MSTLSVADDEGEDLDPNLYLERRLKALDAAKSAGRRVFCGLVIFIDRSNMQRTMTGSCHMASVTME